MADENLELSAAERDLVLGVRAAAAAKKQQGEKPVDIDDISPNMSTAQKKRVMDKIRELWK